MTQTLEQVVEKANEDWLQGLLDKDNALLDVTDLAAFIATAVRKAGYVKLCKKGTCSACDPVRKIKEEAGL